MSIAVEARNLSCCIGVYRLLQDISFTVTPGRVVGVIGPNGAGKTTLLKVMAGLLPVETGSLTLDNRTLEDWPLQERGRSIAYLPQTTSVSWTLTVEQIVRMGRLPYCPDGRLKGSDLRAVDEALAQCELTRLSQRSFNSLSAGESARVNLARLFATQPRLILADEPVASLDPGHEIMLMEHLTEQSRTSGTTTILVLHDLALASRWCDYLVLLHNGKLVADGDPDQVITRQNLLRWYEVDSALHEGRYGKIPEYLLRKP